MKNKSLRTSFLWLILLSLIGGSIYYFYAFGPKMIDEMVTEFVDDTVDAQIKQLNLPIDSFKVSFDEEKLLLYNYDLLAHSYSGRRRKALQEAGIHLVLDSVFISGINWERLYLDSILLIDNVRAVAADINAPKWIVDSLAIPKISQIKSYSINSISLDISRVKLSDESRLILSTLLNVTSLTIEADSVSFDQSISINSWSARTKRITTTSIDGIHDFSIDGSGVSGEKVSFTGLRLKPRYNSDNLSENLTDENTIFNISIPLVRIDLTKVLEILQSNRLELASLEIKGLEAKIFSDLAITRLSERRMLQSFIKDLPMEVNLDRVQIKNSSIIFQLRKPGFADNILKFSALKVDLTNVTNIRNKLKNDNLLVIDLSAKFNEQVPLSMKLNFDMTDPLESYYYTGHLGAMNLSNLSPVLLAMKDMSIKEGRLINLDWEVKANSKTASGWLDFEYDGLKMGQNNKHGIKDMDLLKFVATKFLVSTNNLHGQYFVRGDINATRLFNKSMFYHMWESLFSGIESTLKP